MFHAIEKERAEEFHDLLQYLSKHFAILPLETVVTLATRSGSRRSTVLALSFDDGLRDHWSVVYPVPVDLRLPATFYVYPGLIGRPQITWTWEALVPHSVVVPSRPRREFPARAGLAHSADVEAILQWMKTLPLEGRKRVEEDIRLRTPGFAYNRSKKGLRDSQESSHYFANLPPLGLTDVNWLFNL